MTVRVVIGAILLCVAGWCAAHDDLAKARDRQDRAALEQMSASAAAEVQKQPRNTAALYRQALANSYLAQVATEMRDKAKARDAAQSGIKAAEQAVAIEAGNAEYHRILGTLCGQIVPGNVLLAVKYGQCALQSIDTAIKLNPRSATAYLSRGVGNYYLPPAFGGGQEKAIADFRKAVSLDPRLAEGWLWLGIALRETNKNAEARQAITKSLELNPERVWARQQLEKTPAR